MDARGKFGEHERCVRVEVIAEEIVEVIAECNCSFLSALQTFRVYAELDIRTAKSMNKFFYNRATSRICAKLFFFFFFYCDRAQNSHNAQ